MIDHRHNFIFVHIPKNAGTTISNFLKLRFSMQKVFPVGWHREYKKYKQHFTMEEYVDYGYITQEQLSEYFTFGFVRNPWDKLVSEFFYRKKLHGKATAKWTFEGFLKQPWGGNNQRHRAIKQHVRPQYDFLYDKHDNCIVDFIGRFENLKEDASLVCDKLKIDGPSWDDRYNKNHKHYTEYYDEETRELVAEKYKKDVEYFGYEFGK